MKKIFTFLFFTAICNMVFSQNCTVNAGTPFTICQKQTISLQGQSGGLMNASPNYLWEQVSGPSCVITSPNSLLTTVTNFSVGVYIFKLSGLCADNLRATDQVQVTVVPNVTIPNAGADQQRCTTGSSTLTANAVAPGETGLWVLSTLAGTNAGSNSFGTPNAPTTTFTSNSGGIKQAIWRISNGICSQDDTVNVTIIAPATINAGVDKTISCSGTSTVLAGSNPGLSPQLGTWSVISGPNAPSFGNINSSSSSLSNLTVGTYVLRWTVNGPCSNGFDEVSITVSNNFPKVDLGADVFYTQFCKTQLVSQVLLTDNNLAPGQTGSWTYVSGPGGTSFSSPSSNTTLVNGLDGNSTYVFKYTVTVTATGCTDDALHTIIFQNAITGVTTPTTLLLDCGVTTTTFNTTFSGPTSNGTAATTGFTRTLSFVSGPVTVVAGSITQVRGVGTDSWTIKNLTEPGIYSFRLQYSDACTSESRLIQVVVSRTPPASNAGSDQFLPCNQKSTSLVGSAIGTNNIGTWSQVSGPVTAVIASPNSSSTVVNSLNAAGVYTFRWIISGGSACPVSQDDVVITVATATVVTANAGLDENVCALSPIRLKGNAPGLTQTGLWTVVPSAGVLFANATNPTTTVTGLQPNISYVFTWKISNNCSSSTDDVTFITNGNTIPISIDAGADQCLASGTKILNLIGNVPGANETTVWSALDGGSIANPANNTTTASILANGTYRFVYELTRNGCGPTTDTVIYTVSAPTSIAAAGADQNICSPTATATTSLTATAPTVGVGSWSLYSGSGTVVIASPNTNTTNITNINPGSYVFRYTITNGVCASTFDDVQVNMERQPTTAYAGPDLSQCNSTIAATMAATPATVGTGVWTVLTAPPGANSPTFTNPASPTTNVSGFQTGVYTLRWTITNGSICTPSFDDMVISISAIADASGTTNAICNANVATLTGNAGTAGTWMQNAPLTPNTATITSQSSNTAIASNLIAGAYSFRYTIPIVGSCPSTFSNRSVTISTQPAAADAGPDETLCAGVTTATLTGTPNTGTRRWAWVSGPNNTGTFGSNVNPASATGLIGGVYEFSYTTTNGACTSVDTKLVILENVASAGNDTSLCGISTVQLRGNAPSFSSALWSQTSGPNTAIFNNTSLTTPTISGLVEGTYVFKYTISSTAPCPANFQEVTVNVSTPTVANAGPGITQCQSATSPVLGTASIPGVSYAWTPATNLSNPNIAQPTFTGITAGTFDYTVTASNIGCASTSNTTVQLIATTPTPTTNAPVGLCNAGTQVVAVTNPAFNTTYTWSNGLGTGTSKTVAPGTYTINATNGTCPTVTNSFTIVPQLDYGDLSTNKWPIASAGITSCKITNDIPDTYNATTNPATVVWAGAKINIENNTVGNGNNVASSDSYDDGLISPTQPLTPGYTYQFGVTLNANRAGTTVYYRVWFDWNDDGNFSNDVDGSGNNATYAGSAVKNAIPVTVNFGVKPPVGALGTYKIRLVVSDQPITDVYRANGSTYILNIANGEVEDYATVTLLPISGFTLSGNISNGSPHLYCNTITEVQTQFLEFESSLNGSSFLPIAKLAAAGNSNMPKQYQYIDSKAPFGTIYYRVKATDKDGSFQYSNTVVLQYHAIAETIVYPNPISDKLIVQLHTTGAQLNITDISGKRIYNKFIVAGTTEIQTKHWPSGTYIVQILMPGTNPIIKRIIKH